MNAVFVHHARSIRVLCIGLLVAAWATAAEEQDTAPAYSATTAADPGIPTDQLSALLVPLTQDELAVEADAWLALLKAKAHEISAAEVATKRKNEKIAQTEETLENTAEQHEGAELQEIAEEAAAEAQATEEVEQKAVLLEETNRLRAEQTALADRVSLVLDALDKKGGDTEKQRKYIDAVSGIRVDVSDSTAAWATITGWIRSSEGGLRWAKNLGVFLATLFGFWLASVIVGRAMDKLLGASRNVTALMREFISKSVRRSLLAVGVIVGLSALEINIGPLLALIGAAGFVVAFALQDTLGNFASGIMILVYRPFDVGDLVDVAGVTGTVASLNLVSVTIRTLDNKVVVVPNNAVWGNVITNATGSTQRRVDMIFGISYDADIEQAQTIMEAILHEHPLVLMDPEAVVRVHELADSSVNFVCRPWVKTQDYWTVYWDVTRSVKQQFDANGIAIPFPQRDVHIYQAATPTASADAPDLGDTRDGTGFPNSPEADAE